MRKFNNPYQSLPLRYPREHTDKVNHYCSSRSSGTPITSSPFPRIVDIWFLSFCMGVEIGSETEVHDSDVHFIDGTILASDSWRIQVLSMFAIGYKKDPKIVEKPGEIIRMANEFAATGMPIVLDMIEKGHGTKLDNICSKLYEKLSNHEDKEEEENT